jgi:hypothetical protein
VRVLETDLAEARDQAEVRQLLSDSGLPATAVTECFRRQVQEAQSVSLREQLIADRLQLIQSESRQPSMGRSQERSDPSGRRTGDAEFLRILKGR